MLNLNPNVMESVSNLYRWVPGWNVSVGLPDTGNLFGLHHYKTKDNPQLMLGVGLQVKCELAGKIVEHEYGYRAEYARILDVVRFYNLNGLVHYRDRLLGAGVGLGVFAKCQFDSWQEFGSLIGINYPW